jgi:hypothetical protein
MFLFMFPPALETGSNGELNPAAARAFASVDGDFCSLSLIQDNLPWTWRSIETRMKKQGDVRKGNGEGGQRTFQREQLENRTR